jgi:hypothetical protein
MTWRLIDLAEFCLKLRKIARFTASKKVAFGAKSQNVLCGHVGEPWRVSLRAQ